MPYCIQNLVMVLHSGGQTGGVNWWRVCYPWGYLVYFHQVGPPGRVGLVVMMSVCPSVCLSLIFSMPLIDPKITWPDLVNSLWPQYPEKCYIYLLALRSHDQFPSTHCCINTLKNVTLNYWLLSAHVERVGVSCIWDFLYHMLVTVLFFLIY